MGVTEGVIMPIIITAHMPNTNANSVVVQGAVAGIIRPIPAGIIRKSDISMPPTSMSAASHHT